MDGLTSFHTPNYNLGDRTPSVSLQYSSAHIGQKHKTQAAEGSIASEVERHEAMTLEIDAITNVIADIDWISQAMKSTQHHKKQNKQNTKKTTQQSNGTMKQKKVK